MREYDKTGGEEEGRMKRGQDMPTVSMVCVCWLRVKAHLPVTRLPILLEVSAYRAFQDSASISSRAVLKSVQL